MVGVLSETEALRPPSLAVIDKTEVEDFAGTAEDVGDLLLG